MAKRLYLYKRGRAPTWYIGDFPSGKKQRSTGLRGLDKEPLARQLLAEAQQRVDSGGPTGPMTVERWSVLWLEELRKNTGSPYTEYEGILRKHVLPLMGRLELAKVGSEDIVKVLRAMKTGGSAPRTQGGCYQRMKQMLARAVPKYLATNPCLAVESEQPQVLPPNEDHDPAWRAGAVFVRPEVEALLFDERIPEDRQMLYALLFLLGVRQGEAVALMVNAWTPGAEPLGQMLVAWSWSTERRCRKKLKTGLARTVPVHPLLAELLRLWLAPGGGRERLVSRAPGLDQDLIVPSRRGGHRLRARVLSALKRDLGALGLRERNIHDTRRTYISLIMNAGGHKDLLKFVSHGQPRSRDAFDAYNVPAWPALCAEVMKLEIARPAPAADVVPLRKYANSGPSTVFDDGHLQPTYSPENPEQLQPVATARSTARATAGLPGPPMPSAARKGHSNEPADIDTPLSTPLDTFKDNARQPVTDHLQALIRAALAALESGDVVAAKAILRRGSGA